MNKILMMGGLLYGLLLLQAERWQEQISRRIRFILFWGLSLYAVVIAFYMSQLPEGSIEFLYRNMFDPIAIFLLMNLIIVSVFAAFLTVVIGKIKSSL